MSQWVALIWGIKAIEVIFVLKVQLLQIFIHNLFQGPDEVLFIKTNVSKTKSHRTEKLDIGLFGNLIESEEKNYKKVEDIWL